MLRAKAHHLHPVVSIGNNGLTHSVLHEIDVNLAANELVKIRVFVDDRDERERLLAEVCAGLDAAPVQHLGKTLTLWRPAPESAPAAAKIKPARTSKPPPRLNAKRERPRQITGNPRRRRRQA